MAPIPCWQGSPARLGEQSLIWLIHLCTTRYALLIPIWGLSSISQLDPDSKANRIKTSGAPGFQEAVSVWCNGKGSGSAARQCEDTECEGISSKPLLWPGTRHKTHTHHFILSRLQQSFQAAGVAWSQLKRQLLNPADGGSYGWCCHRNSVFLPFHRLLRNPERNHMGLSPGSGQGSCQPSVSELQATRHPMSLERKCSSQTSENYWENRWAI